MSRQNDIEDPYKSFDFMKCCLQSSLSDEEIAFELSKLFDKMEDELR